LIKKDYLPHSTYNMENQFDVLIDSYLENKVGIDKSFLNAALSKGLHQNILQLQKDELMNVAGIGNEVIKDAQQKIRSDKIYWMEEGSGNKYEEEFLNQVQDFISHLNRTCYTGINACEFHYAVYEEGSFYKRHKDQFKNDDNRKFSLINYLNEDWLEEDGGQLLVYQKEIAQKIQPHAQTAVFFKSDEMEHEVIKANRSRTSITGWLKSV
jgi:SM-20-related protein